MIKVLLWLWQLPQNLVGFLFSRGYKYKSFRHVDGKWIDVYFKSCLKSAVSLGDYIIVDSWYIGRRMDDTILHEYGHSRQSRYLGWLYLLVVGLPSVVRNLFDRVFHKGWSAVDRTRWYYGGFPERWADVLGGVIRKEF